ncbi:isocitrate lyase family domain-containing protein [Ditylenchus destructor]|nr:isocitrate lyase family domain-containing protein [Ditylenchus destructor]
MERRLVAPRDRVPLAEGRNTGDPDVVRGTSGLVLSADIRSFGESANSSCSAGLSVGSASRFQMMERISRHAKNPRAAPPQNFSSWKSSSHDPVSESQVIDFDGEKIQSYIRHEANPRRSPHLNLIPTISQFLNFTRQEIDHDDSDPRAADCRPRKGLGREPPLEGHPAWLFRRRRGAPARLAADRAHAGQARRREAVEPGQHRAFREFAGCTDRQPGHAAGQGRAEGDLPVRLAGGGRRQPGRPDVSGPVAVPGRFGAEGGQEDHATFKRADEIQWSEGKNDIDYFAPIVADAEAGFGGVLNAFELMKAMIEAGAAGVHFEDQLASVKKCGHMGGKVLVPTREAVAKLVSARLAADVMGTPTVLLARTDADAADLVTSDVDENDRPFTTGERTVEGFYKTRNGLDQAISRGLAYAPYADLVWCETGKPDLEFARRFAEAIHAKFPGKLLAYNCSPSFNWRKNLDDATIAKFQRELGSYGYKFQFITLAGFHALNYGMFNLAHGYARRQMSAFVELQEAEFEAAERGFTAVKHQREVGTGYFDAVTTTIEAQASTAALKGSTEDEQFFDAKHG